MNQYSTDSQTLSSITRSSITSIKSAIEVLNQLIENLKIYQQCVIDSVNLIAESAENNSTKYSYGTYSQSHTLPGVIQSNQVFDHQEADRMIQINDLKEKVLRQKRIYFRLLEKDSKLYFQSVKALKRSDISFEEFLEILDNNIDLSIQPNGNDKRNKKTIPGIKLSIDQKLSK